MFLLRKREFVTMLLILSVVKIAPASFQQADSTEKIPFRVPKVNAAARIDGELDEPFWQDAVVIEAGYEVNPGENIPAPVKTEGLLVYNDNYIYVGIRAYDPDPSAIRAHITDRDNIWSDDWVLILFDTFNDNRRTYDYACNPFGIQGDMIESTSGGGGSWDAIWESDGKITAEGYVVEMAIPFSSLSFQRSEGDQTWGFDLVRSYPRTVRHHIGTFPRDRNNNCYMCQAEKLVGFAGATPGRNLEFDPTLSALSTSEREDEITSPMKRKERKLDPGLTVRWGLTPNMTLSTTLNPDFSQVEADVQQLDINRRFAIYYSEKRPFFLEGADYFSTHISAVYSRTLADPRAGIKITGKEGAHTIGFFTAQDEITNLLFPGAEGSNSETMDKRNTSTVLRYKRDVGQSSNLGLLITDREGENYHNRVAGVDGIVKFTQKDQIRFQYLRSNTAYPRTIAADFDQPFAAFDGGALSAFCNHNTRSWEVYGFYNEITPDFRADLGFISQADYRYSEIGGAYKWQREPGHWYNWISLYASYDLRREYNYRPLHKAFTSRLNYSGPLQSNFGVYGEYGRNQFQGREFRANWLSFWLWMRPSGAIGAGIEGNLGDQIDYDNSRQGSVLRLYPEIEYKIGQHLTVVLAQAFERLDVDPGRLYTANISRVHLVYQLNKRTFLRTIFQYRRYERNVKLYKDEVESENKGFFSQVLFSYKINPQTVLFFGYSDNYYGDQSISLTQENRTFFAKLGYAWRIYTDDYSLMALSVSNIIQALGHEIKKERRT